MTLTKGRTPTRLADPAEVARAYRLLVGDGNVTELRALEAQRQGDYRPGTLFGYFNDAEALAAAVGTIPTAKGIYIVPNAVNPALLARAANRIKQAGKGDSTPDGYIVRRRWLLIDADAERPSGISATDEEHAAALARIQDIVAYLRSLGWPPCIVADSGNGGHALYRIDLPADDGGIVLRCLQALAARFTDAAVKVDTSVDSPANLWKLYGTTAAKGDSIPSRPHRMARIIDAPQELQAVPSELLQALAAEAPMPAAAGPRTDHAGGGQVFDVAEFIRRHRLEVDGPEDWNGKQGPGRLWTFRTCPMCEHGGDGPYILQHAGGAVSAGCHHNSCKGKWTWQDLRQRLEPRDERPVDASGILGQGAGRRDSTPATAKPAAGPVPWPELERLTDGTLPTFPLQALPETLRGWVAAESHATQTPADLAGLLALAVCSSCIARHLDIEPQAGWREPVNLFVSVLLTPGNRKSAVFSDATAPLREAERALIEAARPAVAREQSERRQAQKRLDRCEKLAAEKGDTPAAAEAQELAERLALWPEPVLPRLIVDDVTGEKLGIILAEQGGRLASLSPEGGVFDVMAGRYSKNGAPEFDVYLKGHAGDELRTDRVSRKGVYIERPALTCGYAIQPQVIAGIAGDAAFRGRGLLGRFLYAAPRSWIGEREIRPRPVSQDVAEAYAAMVRGLATDPPQGTLTLEPDAAELFDRWQAEVEAMLADGGDLEAIRDWGGKLAGATARLAAVLHCAQHPDGAMRHGVDAATVAAAVAIGRYLIPHAEAVLTMMLASDAGPVDDARYVLGWIQRHGRRDFTKREAQQHGKRRFPKADGIDPALAELTRRGYIRPKPQDAGGPGRPPSPPYEVNMAVFDSENTETRSQYSQNPAPVGNSENIENTFEQSETTKRVRVTI